MNAFPLPAILAVFSVHAINAIHAIRSVNAFLSIHFIRSIFSGHLLFLGGLLFMTLLTAGDIQASPQASATKEIYFAGGCFWGVQEYFSRIPGVFSSTAGYANGTKENPTYQEVCTGSTGHAETVRVVYDPGIVSLKTLATQFFAIIDPVSVNRQGHDVGTQYRTGMYFTDAADKAPLAAVWDAQQQQHDRPLAVELAPLTAFYPAEAYHQDYLKKNPTGYCHISFESLKNLPKLLPKDLPKESLEKEADGAPKDQEQSKGKGVIDPARYSKPDPDTIKANLTPLEYDVTQHAATEPAFTGTYWNTKEAGIYVDVVTGEPLFLSVDKFASGTGWPSFTKPVDPKVVTERNDTSYGMLRTEVLSRVGHSHLGHVFDDGPETLGGRRYCINSAALRFVPLADMEQQGYGDLIPLLLPSADTKP